MLKTIANVTDHVHCICIGKRTFVAKKTTEGLSIIQGKAYDAH